MSEEILYIDDGGLVYYINENEFFTCDEIPMPMLEGIKHLQQKVEQLENIKKEIKEYIEKNVVCCKNSDMLVELNVDDLLNILNKGSEKDVKKDNTNSN